MKTLVFTKSHGGSGAGVDRLLTELERLRIDFENIDVDSRDGAARAQLYDVMQTPAVITTSDDGQLLYSWQELLPDPGEINRLAYI